MIPFFPEPVSPLFGGGFPGKLLSLSIGTQWVPIDPTGFLSFYLCLYRSLCLCLYLCPYPCLYLYLYLYLYWLRTVAIATNRYRWLRTAAIATNRYRWLPLVTALPIAAKDKIPILPIDTVGI